MGRTKIFWNNHVYCQLDMQVNMVNKGINNFTQRKYMESKSQIGHDISLLFTTSKPSLLESQTCLTITSKVMIKNSMHLKKCAILSNLNLTQITI